MVHFRDRLTAAADEPRNVIGGGACKSCGKATDGRTGYVLKRAERVGTKVVRLQTWLCNSCVVRHVPVRQ